MHLALFLPLLSLPLVAFAAPLFSTSHSLSRRQEGSYPAPLPVTGPLSDLQDPSVCQTPSGLLFLFASGGGIPIRFSDDGGASWSDAGEVFLNGPPAEAAAYLQESKGSSRSLQGPSCTYENATGEFILFYSATTGVGRNSAIFIATTQDPLLGEWKDGGLVLSSDSSTDYNAVSPNLVLSPGYPPYLSFELRMVALDEDTYKPVSDELINLAERLNEATIGSPTFFQTDSAFNWYLLSTFDDPSVTSLWPSQIRMARSSRSLTDPYRAQDGGLMWNGDATVLLASHDGVKSPASPSVWFSEAEGKWKLAYQYVDECERYQIGFNCLDFDEETGWPFVAGA
ncbi:hypothetical protein JCM8547_009069 [Rhodosporidiobolus lusitaniae]